MNITRSAIQKNRITLSLLFVVVLLGISMYSSLPRDSMPPYTVRVATIVSNFPGANPERVELLVSKNLEEVVQEIPEVKTVTSQSRTGLSIITVTLKDEVLPDHLQMIWDELRRKIEAMDNLPANVSPSLNDDDVGVVYGIMVGLLADEFSPAEMEDVAKQIRDDLITLPDSAKVSLGGIQEQQVVVSFDNSRLSEYGLTVEKLQQIIQTTNILETGGQINIGDKRLTLEPSGNFDTLEDLRKTIIPVGGSGQVVYLDEITTITKEYKTPPQSLVRVNGKKAVSLAISLKEGANIIQLGQMVDARLQEYNSRLPLGLEVVRLASLDWYVQQSIADFISNLLQSITIVMLIMLVFLGLRIGLVVASLIPFVTIMTLMLMGSVGMGLNQVTLAALIMALGMMVDNGIVVSESIIVKMNSGQNSLDSASETCSELMVPLLISTLTTSAAFLSFYLAESIMGDIMGPLFVVISFALVSSWIISTTVIPLLAHRFFKASPNTQKESGGLVFSYLQRFYIVILNQVLRVRLIFVFLMLAVFLISLKGFALIPFIFFPDSDRNMITVDINLPLGTKIDTTRQLVEKIETYMAEKLTINEQRSAGIVDWSSYIGEGPESYDLGYSADEPNSSYAHMLVNTSSGEANAFVIRELDSFCFNTFPNADIKVSLLGQGGGGTPVEIRVFGTDQEVLYGIATETKEALKAIAGTKNVMDDWGPKLLKFIIDIDPEKAQMSGLTNEDIAISLQTILSGFQAGTFREGEDSLTILMRSSGFAQQTLEDLENANIFVQSSGKTVPLSQVATIIPRWGFAKIQHYDLSRAITVSSYLKEGYTAQEVTRQIDSWLAEKAGEWPSNYRYELGGDAQNTQENMSAVTKYLPLSGCIILLLLILQFNSIRKTFMVISTIPLAIIGVVAGLIIFRSYFGFMAFLGVISLAGIVINNAIVLLDRIELEKEVNGRESAEAVTEACKQRFRPILLTTFTTTLGLIPLYLGGGVMWEPMAVAIMVGLLFGTCITLLFIPAIYSILYRVPKMQPVHSGQTK